MSLRTIACWCVISIALSIAAHAKGQEAPPVKITVYADSVINADYFRVFLVDSLIRNHEVVDVISMSQLRDMFASTDFRRVKVLVTRGRQLSDDEYAIDNGRIKLGRKDPLSLPDVQSIAFVEKRNITRALGAGIGTFLVVGMWAALVEVVERAKGLEFETEKVLAYGGAFGLLGFTGTLMETREKTVYFTFAMPLMRER